MKSSMRLAKGNIDYEADNNIVNSDEVLSYLKSKRINKVVQIRDAGDETDNSLPVKTYIDPRVRICLERAELVTQSYQKTEGEPWILQRAKALEYLLTNMTIYIVEGEQIVGNYASSPEKLPTYPEFSSQWLVDSLDEEYATTLSKKEKSICRKLHEYWKDRNVEGAFKKVVPPELEEYINSSIATAMFTRFWPLGFLASDFKDWVLPLGLKGVLEKISYYRSLLSKSDPDYQEKLDFYEAGEITARAVIAFANRYADLAGEKAAETTGKIRDDYLRIAEICSWVPENPPRTYHEALQMFFFCHLVTAQIEWFSDGIGQRFDLLFYPYYKKDQQNGLINYERAVELLEFLWLKLDDLGQINPVTTAIYQAGGTKFQNISVGGVDEKGNDATNDISFAVIDATMRIRTPQPAICLLYHEKINPRLVDKAIDCIASGMGMPSIFNNDVCINWHLNITMVIAYPETGPYVGVPVLGAMQKLKNSRYVARLDRDLKNILPEKMSRRLDDYKATFLYDLFNSLDGEGKVAGLARGLLKQLNILDVEKALALARGWAPTSCVGGGLSGAIVVQGTLSTILILSVLDFLKCFEYVMYQGVDPVTGKQAGMRTPDPRTFENYAQFIDAYLEQIRYQVERANEAYQIIEKLYEEFTPRPFASILTETPVMKGMDATRKGDAAISEIFSMGSINAGDSLAVVKKLVFDDKTASMDELINACAANWKGYEELHRKCLSAPKFGNDNDYTDSVVAYMYEKVSSLVNSFHDHWGKPLQLESSLAAGYYVGGLTCGATPDGRVKGETVSDGQLSPMHGRDLNGPTAVLKSCSRIDPLKTWNQLLNQRMMPQFLRGENKKAFADYLKTWHSFKNWHIQVNCQNAGDLKDAMKHPEKHRDLVVRVAGYSAYFTDLAEGVQKDIIRRTEQNLSCYNANLLK